MKYFLKSLLSAERGSLSSKRLCGIISWVCCSAVLIICTITERQAPEMIDIMVYASTALLGVDSITDIWKREDTNSNTNKINDTNNV